MKKISSLFVFSLLGFVLFGSVSFAAEKIEIIEFSATWCGPCQKIKLSVEAFAESINNNPKSNQDYIVRLVDIDERLDQFGVSYDGPIPKAIPAMRYNHVTSNNVQGVMDRVSEQIQEQRPPPGPSSPAPDLIQIISEISKQMPSADFQITGMYGEKTDKGFKVHAIVLKIDGRDDPVVVDIDINSTASLSRRVGEATRNSLATLPVVAPTSTPVPAPTSKPPANPPAFPSGSVPGPEPYESTLTSPVTFEQLREISKSGKRLMSAINAGIGDFLNRFASYHLNSGAEILISLSSNQTAMRIQTGFCGEDGDETIEIPWSPIQSERPDSNGVRRLVAIRLAECLERQERLKKARPKPDKTKLVPVQRLPITPNELQDYVRRHLKDQ